MIDLIIIAGIAWFIWSLFDDNDSSGSSSGGPYTVIYSPGDRIPGTDRRYGE
jgi:hypothetical protein